MGNYKTIVPGLAVTAIIAVISYLTSSLHPSFDLLVISIIFGMLISSMLGEKEIFEPGTEVALKIFLPIGIGLYGAQLKFGGPEVRFLPSMAVLIAMAFFITYHVSRALGLDKPLSLLLGSGISVCGASAIVIVAPLINAKKEDTSISLISIITVGLTGMLTFKFLPQLVGMSANKFAFLSGGTLPMVGQVKVASQSLGPEAAALAMSLKVLRIAFLMFLVTGMLIFAGKQKKRFTVPWFIAVFFALAVVANASPQAAAWLKKLEPVSRFSLSMALAAIGLSIDIDSITEKGSRPLLASFLSWGMIVLMLFLALNVLNV